MITRLPIASDLCMVALDDALRIFRKKKFSMHPYLTLSVSPEDREIAILIKPAPIELRVLPVLKNGAWRLANRHGDIVYSPGA